MTSGGNGITDSLNSTETAVDVLSGTRFRPHWKT